MRILKSVVGEGVLEGNKWASMAPRGVGGADLERDDTTNGLGRTASRRILLGRFWGCFVLFCESRREPTSQLKRNIDARKQETYC